ncbi:TadE/TadG family type IV pilus assembly protein [Arthrobacter sp. QXT-31]|uniref:TadE/TadG family type IV pilus assembly protein n=1 Tax=Arthrobacter sp. QXT-31 TaxID=1357915 RepID=UPI0009719EFF|nr:TadE/TadG family type IV pilus assembly protein [Arthrobacter sp. QXT-31]APX03137.1 pilus assembly protein TadG [Arthrobacter sp. QXT-31]
MRRLASGNDGERGGIAVVVAILMVVLLGFAALAIDVAGLYSERAQLQNGSDAAALMMAQKCAKNESDTNCSATSPLAADLANKNAVDNLSNIKSVALDKVNRTVTVAAGAKEIGGAPNSVSLFFANVLGIPSAEVNANSSVRWGSPVEGITPFPLAFSVCQVSGMVDGATQLLQNHTSNKNTDCNLGPAGKTVPGGFAWIVQSTGQCGGLVNLAINQSGSDTGNDGPSNCDGILNKWATDLSAGKPVTVLLPVYEDVSGTGSGASYDLLAFASFSVEGWAFSGADKLPLVYNNASNADKNLQCKGDCRGIIGKFVKYVSLADGYKLGPVSPYGATVVELTS